MNMLGIILVVAIAIFVAAIAFIVTTGLFKKEPFSTTLTACVAAMVGFIGNLFVPNINGHFKWSYAFSPDGQMEGEVMQISTEAPIEAQLIAIVPICVVAIFCLGALWHKQGPVSGR